MTALRRIRFTLSEWILAVSWEWHMSVLFLTLLFFWQFPNTLWPLCFPLSSLAMIILRIVLRRGYRKLKPATRLATITHLNNERLILSLGLGASHVISRDMIVRVAFFKTDEPIVDLVCCEVLFEKGNQLVNATVPEDVEKFNDFVTWLEGLPSFDAEWRSKVAQLGFKSHAVVAFIHKSTA